MNPLVPRLVRNGCSTLFRWLQPQTCNTCSTHASSPASFHTLLQKIIHPQLLKSQTIRLASSNALVNLKIEGGTARFCVDNTESAPLNQGVASIAPKRVKKKMSRKAKLNELRFYRLKAKRKMRSPNPEVRIRYKLGKAKRKEEWLLSKLRRFDTPKLPDMVHDPESLTEEERFFLKRTGEKKKNYINVGRRGVFGGVVLNMHLHWKNNETVKVVCRPCRPGQVHEFAEELARLSKGIIIDIKADNTIIFYRGKNYEQPNVMSPPCTLSKHKALEKYKFEQSLEHTSSFIERLEQELVEYHKYLSLYKKNKDIPVETYKVKYAES